MYELNFKSWACIILTGLFLVVGGVGSCMYIRPKYNVWQQEMAGKAEFAKAEQNRKIKIEEAKANLEAEKLNAFYDVQDYMRQNNGESPDVWCKKVWQYVCNEIEKLTNQK